MKRHEMSLLLPAQQDDALVARMALSGLGMVAGLDADSIGDLCTVINECYDCLMHQPVLPTQILLEGWVENDRLSLRLSSKGEAGRSGEQPLDLDVARCVLETLMPHVELACDERGVSGIICSTPV